MKLLFFCLLIFSFAARGEGLIGFGAGSLSEYQGSSENQTVPIGIFNFSKESYFLEVQGPQIVLNSRINNKFSLGPIISFNFGRDAFFNSENEGVEASELPFSFDYGLNFQYELPNLSVSSEDSFSVRFSSQKNNKALSNSLTHRLSVRYFLKILFLLRTEFEIEARYSSDNYINFLYGVNDQVSNDLSIDSYRPREGFESFTFSQNIILSFSEHTGVLARYAITRFESESRNSPLINELGESTNLFVGLAAFYRWE